MNKIALILGFHAALAGLWAQGTTSQVRIQSTVPGVRFYVDDVPYTTAASFFWTENSRHILRVLVSESGYQYPNGESEFANRRFAIAGWSDPSGDLILDAGFTQIIYASPELHTIVIEAQAEYRQRIQITNAASSPPDSNSWECTGANGGGPGVVFINGTCYSQSTDFWSAAGEVALQAYPYPRWAFAGWIVEGGTPTSATHTFNVTGSNTIYAKFVRARRVKFLTEPLGLQVLVDGSPSATPRTDPCPTTALIPYGLAPGSGSICVGEFDWAVNSKHMIGVESQRDKYGNAWVFDSFSNGLENHSVYDVTSNSPETVVAKLVRGVTVTFNTAPPGLSLIIDGHDNHRAYNFMRAPGTVIGVAAPAEQVDANGRKLVFKSWSNGGDREQQLEVPADAENKGFRLTATYELLSQAVVVTDPAGVTVDVDGATCDTPCTIDRPAGTEVIVTVPENQVIGEVQRLHFEGWADGGPRTRAITISGSASAEYRANYSKRYLLRTSSSPSDGAALTMEPSSEDGYYTDGVSVKITAEANDGFSFRRWEGDLQGTYNVGTVKMSRPRTVIAMLDEVPFTSPAVVMNAAGKTPKDIVAPGSMIAIYGVDLAPHPHVGNANPLEQTLVGTTVRIADRVLALSYVSPSQINAVMHPDIPVGRHLAIISRNGELDVEGEVEVTRNAPGLFAYYLEPNFFIVAHHEDGTPVLPESPARRGELISIFGTGFGEYNGIAPYGFALPESPEYLLVDTVEAFAGDMPIEPEFAGGAPRSSGMDVLKIRITEELPSASTVEFKIRINNEVSNTVLLPLE